MELTKYKSLLESPINKLISAIGDELKQVAKNRLLEYQTTQYNRNFYTKTLLHRSEPVKLTDFYLPLSITPYKKKRSVLGAKNERVSTSQIDELFTDTNYITLIGNAGSGKSTIVKYLFINSVEKNFKIPIKVELRYLNEYKGNLKDYIYSEIFDFHNLGFSREIINRVLSSDSFVFFFDGYDEIISSKKEAVTKDIDNFVSRFPDNYFLLTSRPYTNIDVLPLFKNFSVCNLLETEIPAFVKKQVRDNEDELAEKIIKAIGNIKGSSYRTFLSNPLLLSMFILTFQSYSEIPQKRSDFYKQVFDTLYSVHDSVSKLSYVREKKSGLSRDGFIQVLRLLSFISYFEEKFLFKADYLNDKLDFIKKKKPNLKFGNIELIDDLQVAIGILNKEGLEYTFPHRSLQEYFASNYISSLSEENRKITLEKILDKIEADWLYLIYNNHFFSLLLEQNYTAALKYLAIPALENLIHNASNEESRNFDSNNEILGKVLLVKMHLLLANESSEIDKFFKDFKPKIQITRTNQKGASIFITPVTDDKSNDNYKKNCESAIIKLSSSGENWIQELKDIIDDQEKSDTEIIDII